MSFTYSDVDRSPDPMDALRWQRNVDRWPAVRAYKRRVQDALADLSPVLDVGCGPGDDIAACGADLAVGIDLSQVMCTTAAQRGPVCRADGHALPFATGSLGGAFADRVLQHVERPEVVVDEMIRVLRPGGRLVIADPDQETLTITIPGVRQELVDKVKALRRDRGYRNGRLIGNLPYRLATLGTTDVSIEGFAVTLTDPGDAFGLATWLSFWREVGRFTDDDERRWIEAVERGRDRGFVYAVTYFVVVATKPSRRDLH